MKTILIKQACLVNEGKQHYADVLVNDGHIEQISATPINRKADIELNGEGLHLFPGAIDDQVHFREPGLTQKGEIYTEAKAAVAGGITSYMEMPNTVPNTLTQELLEDKYRIASQRSLANYSFYMGASNDNYDEVMRTNSELVCGIKIFMGSSTGNMLVDNQATLERLFSNLPVCATSFGRTMARSILSGRQPQDQRTTNSVGRGCTSTIASPSMRFIKAANAATPIS